jgi:hypothetical protein
LTDPRGTITIVAGQHVGGHDHGLHFFVHGVHDGRRHTVGDRHGQERAGDGVAVRDAEANVGGAARGVHTEFVLQATQQSEHLLPSLANGTDGHHEWVNHHVAGGDAVVGCPLNNSLGDGEPHVGIFRDARLIVGDSYNRSTVASHERQDALQYFFFTGNRVDQRLALVHREACFERFDNGRVNRQRHVGNRLHQLHGARKKCWFVREGDAGIHVEHVGTGFNLRNCVSFHSAEIAGFHFRCE